MSTSLAAVPAPGCHTPRGRDTHAAIVRAAIAEFAVHGIAATRLSAVARRAYVAPSTISLHFDGKADLLDACIDMVLRDAWRQADRAVHGHPCAVLAGHWGRCLDVALGERPFVARIRPLAHQQWEAAVRRYEPGLLARLEQDVARARRLGILAADRGTPEWAAGVARLVIALVVLGESTAPAGLAARAALVAVPS